MYCWSLKSHICKRPLTIVQAVESETFCLVWVDHPGFIDDDGQFSID